MKSVKRLSLIWERGCGAQDRVLADCPPEERVVAFHTKKDGRGWSHCSAETMLSMCSKNNGLYEVLSVYPKKVYFDVDFTSPPDDFEQKTSAVAGWRHQSAEVTALQEIFWTEQV